MDMKRKFSFRTIAQEFFLTCTFFMQNDLITYAYSCAFGFIFSLLPVVIMTATVLVRVLHASPSILQKLFVYERFLHGIVNIPSLVDSFLNVKGSIVFELFIGLSLLWMARRFFNSVVKGIHCIFHKSSPRRPFAWQLVIIAGEILIVVFLALLIFVFTTAGSLIDTDFIRRVVPRFVLDVAAEFLKYAPALVMFAFVAVVFKVGSGTKPSGFLCIASSFFCTFIFFAFLRIFSGLVDMAKYNLVYGILGNSVVLLLEVFVFFVLFLFFAQMIFVHQFFDQLLLAELYLLPSKDAKKFTQVVRRNMFITPDYFVRNKSSLIVLPAGAVVFTIGDETKDVYYLAEGTVRLSGINHTSFCQRGGFFGELSCVFDKPREMTACAQIDSKVICIAPDTFVTMLNANPEASQKVLAQISAFFSAPSQTEGFTSDSCQ